MPDADSSDMDDSLFAAKLSEMPGSFLLGQVRENPDVFIYLMSLEGSPLLGKMAGLCAANLPLLGAFRPGSLPEGFLAGVAARNPDGVLEMLLGSGAGLGTEEKGAVVAALSVFDPNALLLKKWAQKLDDGMLRSLISRKGMPKGTYAYAVALFGAVKLGPELQLFAVETHGAGIVPYMLGPSPQVLAIHAETKALLAYAAIAGKYLGTAAVPAGIHTSDALPLIRDELAKAMEGEDKKAMRRLEPAIAESFAAASAAHPKTAILDLGKAIAAANGANAGEKPAFEEVPPGKCERALLKAITAYDPELPKAVRFFTPRLAKAYAALPAHKEKAAKKAAPAENPALEPSPKAEADKHDIFAQSAARRISAIKAGIKEGKIRLPAPGKAAM